MNICEYFNQGQLVVSFEIFPPKPTLPVESVYATIAGLKELKPAFISVTYGAGGGSSARTIEIADKVKNDYGIETLAHLTCVGQTKAEIDSTIDRLERHNIRNILALRGDPPQGASSFIQPENGYRYAMELVSHIKSRNQFCIAAAAYPEGHLECRDVNRDIGHLKLKVEQGVDFLITQLFFHNELYYRFRDKMAAAGVTCPVSIGVMPVLNAAQVKKITALCGASIPGDLRQLLEQYETKPEEMEKAGIEYACRQIEDLVRRGVDGIHLYTMNKVEQIKEIMRNTGLGTAR